MFYLLQENFEKHGEFKSYFFIHGGRGRASLNIADFQNLLIEISFTGLLQAFRSSCISIVNIFCLHAYCEKKIKGLRILKINL